MRRRRVISLGLLAIALAGLGCVALWVPRAVLFPAPHAPAVARPPAEARTLWLEHAHGRTEAWLLPAARSPDPAPLIVFFHGNGELIDDWGEAFVPVARQGLGVLLVEYPGYGRSGGSPSESSIRSTVTAAYDWAVAQPEVDPDRVVAYGRSLGGGAACALADQRPVAALVLESTFTSVPALARARGVPGFLVRDRFDNERVVRGFPGPVRVTHGDRDRLIPVAHGRALAQAAAAAQLEILLCGHNDCPRDWPGLLGFLSAEGIL